LGSEHVIVEHDRVEVFDPVEFDPALREIDVSADLAFLRMDLIDASPEELAKALVDEYKSAGGDHGGRPLLSFYAAYRAWVGAKVACLRAGELAPGGARSVSDATPAIAAAQLTEFGRSTRCRASDTSRCALTGTWTRCSTSSMPRWTCASRPLSWPADSEV
jgi:aminoglycoside phosphotransferase family enzyme